MFRGRFTIRLRGCGIEIRGDRWMMSIDRVGYAEEEGTRTLRSVTLPESKYRFERSDNTARDARVDDAGAPDSVRRCVDCVLDPKRSDAHIRAAVVSPSNSHLVNTANRERRASAYPRSRSAMIPEPMLWDCRAAASAAARRKRRPLEAPITA